MTWPQQQPPGGGVSTQKWVIGGLVAAVVVLVGVLAFVLGSRSSDSGSTSSGGTSTSEAAAETTSTTTTTTLVTTTAPTTVPTTVPPPVTPAPAPADPRTLPAGLFCRDLKARGYSYSAAVDYWQANGEPDRMDADRNGIPCETVYPRSDVVARWGGQEPSSGPPPGLSCRQIADGGYSYAVAVAYWYYEGLPARMDVDGNGIPCETVYPPAVVQAFWG